MSVIDSVKDYLKDRTTNPLFGSYLVSWLACNWRFPALLLSDEKVLDKYRIAESVVFDHSLQGVATVWGLPALLALAYTFIWPAFDGRLRAYRRRWEHRNNKRLLVADEIRPLSPEEAAELESKLKALAESLGLKSLEVDTVRAEVTVAMEKSAELERSLQNQDARVRIVQAELERERERVATAGLFDKRTLRLMLAVHNSENGLDRPSIRTTTGLSDEDIRQVIERDLRWFEVRTPSGLGASGERVALTQAGREIANAIVEFAFKTPRPTR